MESAVGNQIIQDGPYLPGYPLPAWAAEPLAAADWNALRDELIVLRTLVGHLTLGPVDVACRALSSIYPFCVVSHLRDRSQLHRCGLNGTDSHTVHQCPCGHRWDSAAGVALPGVSITPPA